MKSAQPIDRTHPSPPRARDRIVILGSAEWVAWVERLSVTARLPIPVLFDNALAVRRERQRGVATAEDGARRAVGTHQRKEMTDGQDGGRLRQAEGR